MAVSKKHSHTAKKIGVLVIITSEGCGVCISLEKSGLFDEIENSLNSLVEIRWLEFKKEGPNPKLSTIFTPFIGDFIPKFMFMSEETFVRAEKSGDNWQSVIKDIRYFGKTAIDNGTFIPNRRYTNYNINNIRDFCETSFAEIQLANKKDRDHIEAAGKRQLKERYSKK
jgi:hypothetical protein